ncbi:arginine N-succinyltransferase [Gammaproteobacteria bacterium AS21]|jgi:arginine N-succinyltransferase
MLFIRPSKMSDLDELLAISSSVGDGMTSMPNCKKSWQKKLQLSEQAFTRKTPAAQSCYFMVLVDSTNQKIAGTTAIYTGLGLSQPFYSYQRSTTIQQSNSLKTTKSSETLTLVEHYKGATEVGSLFLLPQYRLPGVGQMLARSRYLLMADAQERFSDTVMAELRGWLDKSGQSPLWQGLGSHFFDMSFQQAVTVAATKGSDFITELMPKHPIYTDLLPLSAKEVLSIANESSAPALRMLEKEGFKHNGYIDLFDGGPSVDAKLSEIKTIKDSQVSKIEVSNDIQQSDETYYISNSSLQNFCLIMAKGKLSAQGSLLIDAAAYDLLKLDSSSNNGRFVTLMSSKKRANINSQAA